MPLDGLQASPRGCHAELSVSPEGTVRVTVRGRAQHGSMQLTRLSALPPTPLQAGTREQEPRSCSRGHQLTLAAPCPLLGGKDRGSGAPAQGPGARGPQVPPLASRACTHLRTGRPRRRQELVGPRGSRQLSVEHLHVIWERVTCGSHQAEERLNQGLITVCLEGSGPK